MVDLDLEPTVEGVNIPVLLARGRLPGKTFVALAGVHGDEFEGVRALLDVFAGLDVGRMSGDFLAVPVANPPAFWNGTRTSPLDGENLARVFPGSLSEGPTPVIAFWLANSVIARADLFVDLHSGGVRLQMPTMVGYDAEDPRSHAAALAFGAPVLWAHAGVSPGRTISFAKARGIPWLYTEARGAGRIDPSDLRILCDGILNLLRHLSILPSPAPVAAAPLHLTGEGDIEKSLCAHGRGFLISEVKLLQQVTTGERLGRLVNLHGMTTEVFRAPRDGVVALIHQFPVVEAGEGTYLVTGLHP
jgi:N2-acetyl-L-2,4-diaminobutanoate deacetylase